MRDKVNPLEIIDIELAKADAKSKAGGASGKRNVFLYLKLGHTALIRPLYELNKLADLALQKHDIFSDDLKVASICASEIGKECFYCLKADNENNTRLSANYRIYLPIFIYSVKDESNLDVYDDAGNIIQGVKILELGAFGKIGDVLRYFRKYMKTSPITETDFIYRHITDAQGYKSFKLEEQRKKQMNPQIRAIIPSIETAKQYIIDAYAPMQLTDQNVTKYFGEDAEIEEEDDLLPTNFTGL